MHHAGLVSLEIIASIIHKLLIFLVQILEQFPGLHGGNLLCFDNGFHKLFSQANIGASHGIVVSVVD